MNAAEYQEYMNSQKSVDTIHVNDLWKDDKTAAYGYTTDRDTWHCYTHGGEIHVLVYRQGDVLAHVHGMQLPTEILRPNKRVYPDTVDYYFARLMREFGYDLPLLGNFDFTTADVARRVALGDFKGKTHLDFPLV